MTAAPASFELIAVGASTGGTQALGRLLPALEAGSPPVLIAQHIPGGFSAMLAEQLDRISTLQVREARDGEPLRPGHCLVCPGGCHLYVRRQGGRLLAGIHPSRPEDLIRPAVNILFHAAAGTVGRRAIGILLTGMGRDGARGLKAMRDEGAATIAQDRPSSVVWGMPGAAVELGAARHVVPLDRIGHLVNTLVRIGVPAHPRAGSSSRSRAKE